MATAIPTSLTIRGYQVGFGDCFLLTWQYPGGNDRRVLIDFGSNAQPEGAPAKLLEVIAADIKAQCTNGKLDAVVLTHRHKDHIAGFTPGSSAKASGSVIRSLKPDLVMQPWTEDPNAKPDAKEATQSPQSLPGIKGFVGSLANMQQVSAGITRETRLLATTESSPKRREMYEGLAFLGEEGIANLEAIKNLQTMCSPEDHEYLSHGDSTKLSALLPGVKITVLGPPTLKQSGEIIQERSKDAAEFWMFQAGAASQMGQFDKPLFPDAKRLNAMKPPPYARWFIPRLRAIRATNVLQIVRIMDDALNNTSLILLFEIGGKAFLFSGDAQIENWSYTLGKPALMNRLADVDFYKVGHHGSRNATPKSLWKNFAKRGKADSKPRLQTFVSTMSGKYGKLAEGTEVPRETLVAALKADSDFFSTQMLKAGQIAHDVVIPL